MKDTSKILEELKLCPDFKSFYEINEDTLICESLSQMLNDFLASKGLKKSDVIKKSELSETYGYQIFSGIRVPERKKLLCLAVGMELNLQEAQGLLKCAGYPPLYIKIPFDSIIIYGIYHKLPVTEINELLFEYGFESIG